MWNLWHGCHKKSEGCQHCYVFRRDAEFEKDSNVVTKTSCFNLPIRRDRSGMPIYMNLPIKHKAIICEPLLGPIDFHGWLSPSAYATSPINGDAQRCEQVTVGGESGSEARVCDYAWVLGIREQCISANVPFHFKQTGAHFRKDGRIYNIPRNQQMKQAHKAGIDYAYK